MIPGVTINITNGALGKTVQTKDGVVGLVLTVATGGLISTKLFKFTSLQAAVDAGFTSAAEAFANKHISEFYAEAGDGATLYVLARANTVTMTQMLDSDATKNAKDLLDYANGDISILGVASNPSGEATVGTDFVRADVVAAIAGAGTFIAGQRSTYRPIRVVISGRIDIATATPQNLKSYTNNGVCVVLGSTSTDLHGAVGLACGRLAKIPVHRCIGRVKDGSLAIPAAYIGANKVDNIAIATVNNWVDKGYITIRNYPGRSGYYFSDDPTASLPTDDYTNLANGRVVDKALRIAYQVYLDEVNNEIEVDTTTGKLSADACKALEGKMEQNLRTNFAGQISGVTVYVDPDQNVLATSKIVVVIKIVPVGYSKTIEVSLGFDNPFN